VEVLELQRHTGVDHVLRGGTVVHPFAVRVAAACLQLLERGHQRVLDAADLGRHQRDVDVFGPGVGGDDLRRLQRMMPSSACAAASAASKSSHFCTRARFAEQLAQLLGAPQVLERLHVEHGNGHRRHRSDRVGSFYV
jgi:hypothetical protein